MFSNLLKKNINMIHRFSCCEENIKLRAKFESVDIFLFVFNTAIKYECKNNNLHFILKFITHAILMNKTKSYIFLHLYSYIA